MSKMALPSDREALIEVRGLRTQFGSNVVHDNLDFSIYRGEIVGLVGGSGTGKSVLMNSILGLLTPAAGAIRFFGHDRAAIQDHPELHLEKRIGVMFQGGALFSSMTVRENVMVPMREHTNLSLSMMRELADMKLALVGLEPHAATLMPADLSGGMIKRASLARALALDPELLFLDEPTAGLDPVGANAFDELILELRSAMNLTVLMVTHDLDSLYAICDRVAVLFDKRIGTTGPVEEVAAFDHPWVREYFNGPRARGHGGGAEKQPVSALAAQDATRHRSHDPSAGGGHGN